MARSPFSKCDRRLGLFALVTSLALLMHAIAIANQSQPSAVASPSNLASLLERAAAAEADFEFETAAARLYEVILEHPRTADIWNGRLRLARLLALSGNLQGAILECQAVRDELAVDHPARGLASDLATTLSRRLRAGVGPTPFPTVATVSPKGLPELDEPTAIDVDASGTVLLVDSGRGKTYRITGDSATIVGTDESAAATFLRDGTAAIATRTGLARGSGKPALLTGTWGGKTNQVKKIRAMAATSNGDLLVIDKDFDGLLRCTAALPCAPWGPPGKARTVKVGASDFVYVLDDHQQSVRVLDHAGRSLATVGPTIGSIKLGEIVDIAVDSAYGLYLLDRQSKRVHIVALRSTGKVLSVVLVGTAALPTDADRLLKNPSAVAVASDGALIVAGRSAPRFLRLQ